MYHFKSTAANPVDLFIAFHEFYIFNKKYPFRRYLTILLSGYSFFFLGKVSGWIKMWIFSHYCNNFLGKNSEKICNALRQIIYGEPGYEVVFVVATHDSVSVHSLIQSSFFSFGQWCNGCTAKSRRYKSFSFDTRIIMWPVVNISHHFSRCSSAIERWYWKN